MSLVRFGGGQQPLWLGSAQVPLEGPNLGDLDDAVRLARNDVTVSVERDRHHCPDETDIDPGLSVAEASVEYVGSPNADEDQFDDFAARGAL